MVKWKDLAKIKMLKKERVKLILFSVFLFLPTFTQAGNYKLNAIGFSNISSGYSPEFISTFSQDLTINGQSSSFKSSVKMIKISSICGNGFIEGSEQCDDGNLSNGDGCNNQCEIENNSNVSIGASPFTLSSGGGFAQSCGNGLIEKNEQCDDGNLSNGDGCNNQCEIEERQKKVLKIKTKEGTENIKEIEKIIPKKEVLIFNPNINYKFNLKSQLKKKVKTKIDKNDKKPILQKEAINKNKTLEKVQTPKKAEIDIKKITTTNSKIKNKKNSPFLSDITEIIKNKEVSNSPKKKSESRSQWSLIRTYINSIKKKIKSSTNLSIHYYFKIFSSLFLFK